MARLIGNQVVTLLRFDGTNYWEAWAMADFDLFEIMRTTRSMRRLKTDPVPDALLSRILECGTYAASGGNMQA